MIKLNDDLNTIIFDNKGIIGLQKIENNTEIREYNYSAEIYGLKSCSLILRIILSGSILDICYTIKVSEEIRNKNEKTFLSGKGIITLYDNEDLAKVLEKREYDYNNLITHIT